MPGILVMNQNASDAAAGIKDGDIKKRNSDGKLINGERGDAPSVGAVNGAGGSSSLLPGITQEQLAELPPELVQISRESFHNLSTLLLRISQETYNDLTETLQSMADIPLSQQTNGALPNGTTSQVDLETNRQKKLLLMKFAQDNRAKFIKLLVLTEWGKKASGNVAQLIDLFSWAREQQAHIDYVDTQIERIKIFSNSAAEKNPDITTALQILSTGEAPWLPTLGYLPPDPISSDKALKLLRYMNTSLSIRLNSHETLPRRLQNWRIQSGRVTFVIEKDMEFDVVSFVEDVSEQWYFVDLRILFTPAPTITINSRFFTHIKQQADFILQDKGLPGLYDFLLNFVLTHKITVLRSQAMALARSGWSGFLKVEPVHRELVVQYWTERPGKKNWIEIGISNNKPKNGKVSWRGAPIPSLNVRWFRHGKAVEGAKFDFDWQDLSFERVIKRVIARHISDVLQATRSYFSPKVTAHASLSETEPTDCKLHVILGPVTNTATLSLESITGNYVLQPANAVSAKAEYAFNQGREPQQIANILTQVLAQNLRDVIQKYAKQLGWRQTQRQALRMDVLKAAVHLDIIQYALYSPQGWSSNWALAAVVDPSGASWWILQFGGNGSTIEYAEQIMIDRPDGTALTIERATLASLERVAVHLMSMRVTIRKLQKEKKAFSLRSDLVQAATTTVPQRMSQGWVLYLQTSDLLAASLGEKPWLEPSIAVICQGLRQGGQNVWHIAAGKMVKDVAADMHKLMAASPQKSFKFSEDGNFKILLSTPFGEDILDELRARLRDVNRLRSFATTLQKRKMRLGSSSLQRVQFQYGPSPNVAAVNFSSEKEVTIELSPNNPHYRVRRLLTEIANERTPAFSNLYLGDTNGLDRFCTALVLTRSTLTALKSIESQASNFNLQNPAIHAHSIFKYRITYENPVCSFDVRAQAKDDKVLWFIEDNIEQQSLDLRPTPEQSPGHRRLENLQAKLKEFYAGKSERWFGTRKGVVAELDGASDAIRKLHEVVISCTMPGGYQAPPPLETPAPQPQNQAQVKNQQNGPSQQQAQQARMQQARQQQQQQAQNQARRQSQHQIQRMGQMQNGRPMPPQGHHPSMQQQQQQGKMGNRMGNAQQGRKDIIEID